MKVSFVTVKGRLNSGEQVDVFRLKIEDVAVLKCGCGETPNLKVRNSGREYVDYTGRLISIECECGMRTKEFHAGNIMLERTHRAACQEAIERAQGCWNTCMSGLYNSINFMEEAK